MTDAPSSFPVELEPPPTPRRRHRLITAPSGLVLFVCLFLPAVRGCGEPVYPFEVPSVVTPYLLGLIVGLAALIPSAMAGLVVASRAIVWVTVLGWTGFFFLEALHEAEALPWAIGALVAGALLIALFGGRTRDESAAARVTIGTAMVSAVWFGLWCLDGGAMIGVYLSATAAVGLLVGGLEWRREIRRDRDPSGPPRAVVALLVLVALAGCKQDDKRRKDDEPRADVRLHADCESSACGKGQTCMMYGKAGGGLVATCEIACKHVETGKRLETPNDVSIAGEGRVVCPSGMTCKAFGDGSQVACF